MGLRRLLRAGLGLLLLLSMMLSGWSLWGISRTSAGGWLVERGADELGAAYDRVLARSVTDAVIADRLRTRLDQAPRNWVALDGLLELAEIQNIPIPADLAGDIAAARGDDFGLAKTVRDCGRCALDLRECSISASLTCGIAVNMTVIGDFMSLSREAQQWSRGQEVDQIDVALSLIGIGASGLVIVSGGSSMFVKAGAGFLKTAHKTGRMTPELTAVFSHAVREGVDWARLSDMRRVEDVAAALRPDALRPALEASNSLGRIYRRLGSGPSLHLIARIDTPTDARRVARAADHLGPRSVGAMEVLGKSRFMRTGLRLSQGVIELLLGIAGMVSAALALLISAFGSHLLRQLRRLTADQS